MKTKKRTSPLRYKDLEVDDVLYDENGFFYRVTQRDADAWSSVRLEMIVPRFKVVGIVSDHEMSGGGQSPHHYFFGFDSADWLWHSRHGCLIA